MEKFGVHNEENDFGVNKLIKSILLSNGHYEEYTSGDDLFNTKFSMLIGAKKDYGLAYLKLKFREKGLDIEDLKVHQDLSELQHNGVSKVIIDFKNKKYQKMNETQNTVKQENKHFFQHPKAQELNELERKKQIAKQNNNQEELKYYQSLIEKIVKENELSISSNEWDKLTDEEKESFYKIKMNEAKVFNDEVNYNYWKSNLKRLQEKEETRKQINSNLNLSGTIQELKNELLKIQNEYHIMLEDGYIDNQELQTLLVMIDKVINDAYSLKRIATNEDDIRTISSIIDILEKGKGKMVNIQESSQGIGR